MLVAGTRKSLLSTINRGGKWVEPSIEADSIYQTILIAAEKAFFGERSRPANLRFCSIAIPRSRGLKAVRVVDMNASNSLGRVCAPFCETRQAHAGYERGTRVSSRG
jgi:hypothetical protein